MNKAVHLGRRLDERPPASHSVSSFVGFRGASASLSFLPSFLHSFFFLPLASSIEIFLQQGEGRREGERAGGSGGWMDEEPRPLRRVGFSPQGLPHCELDKELRRRLNEALGEEEVRQVLR